MAPISRIARQAFADWGKKGGRARAHSVTPAKRAAIAALAARSRWGRTQEPAPESIRLQTVRWDNPVWLEEVLSEGSLQNWKLLYHRITDHPFGKTAAALAHVLESTQIYGITPLWKGLLKRAQGPAS